jgi:hypothetical protein
LALAAQRAALLFPAEVCVLTKRIRLPIVVILTVVLFTAALWPALAVPGVVSPVIASAQVLDQQGNQQELGAASHTGGDYALGTTHNPTAIRLSTFRGAPTAAEFAGGLTVLVASILAIGMVVISRRTSLP